MWSNKAKKGNGRHLDKPQKSFRARRQPEPEPARHFPIFTITLGIVQVICQLLFTWNVISPDPFYFNYTKRYQLWRYLSIALVHNGSMHLLSNLFLQLLYGICLERIHGWKRILIIFFAGTTVAELTMPILTPINESEGSSSGVFALISAYLASLILNPHLVTKIGSFFLGVVSIFLCLSEPFSYIYVQIVLWQCKIPQNHFTLALCETTIKLLKDSFSWISVYSHILGAMTGVVVGMSVLKITRSPNSWQIRIQKWASILSAIMGIYLGVRNIFPRSVAEFGNLEGFRSKIETQL